MKLRNLFKKGENFKITTILTSLQSFVRKPSFLFDKFTVSLYISELILILYLILTQYIVQKNIEEKKKKLQK